MCLLQDLWNQDPRYGCGCPLEQCCNNDQCVDGAVCLDFPGPADQFTGDNAELKPRTFKQCVLAPVSGDNCGKINGSCCYTGDEAFLSEGTCTEDTDTRVGECVTEAGDLVPSSGGPDFGGIGPRCLPGVLKLSNEPDCGEPQVWHHRWHV